MCHNLRDRGRRRVLITSSRTQRWQHAVKPDLGSESRFLPTPPAFDAPIRGFPSEYCHAVWFGKNRMAWPLNDEKKLKIRLFVLTESTNVTDRQTQTDTRTDTKWRHRPRLHSIARQSEKNAILYTRTGTTSRLQCVFLSSTVYFYCLNQEYRSVADVAQQFKRSSAVQPCIAEDVVVRAARTEHALTVCHAL